MILNCMCCGESFEGEEPEICCNGRDCGCMGLPVEPVCCSYNCEHALIYHKGFTHFIEVWNDGLDTFTSKIQKISRLKDELFLTQLHGFKTFYIFKLKVK